ncbi:TPA: hypothetical protein L3V69_001420 [Vibrio parahaemolyticus]|nr:hypothetical protein [Vibrio parahaemolyticus]HBN6316405.1 hypothetical protein [Vibrio parahaemolyticus]HCD5128852.1 hypothetical protein [Vibrio parahaemolyticus]HCD5207925.1 hypothetical protein [Vibrio parahaemolyticus]
MNLSKLRIDRPLELEFFNRSCVSTILNLIGHDLTRYTRLLSARHKDDEVYFECYLTPKNIHKISGYDYGFNFMMVEGHQPVGDAGILHYIGINSGRDRKPDVDYSYWDELVPHKACMSH